jgi:hypothetical protein
MWSLIYDVYCSFLPLKYWVKLMNNKLTTISLTALAMVGLLSLTSSKLSSTPQQGWNGPLAYSWATSGTFDTAMNNVIVSATTDPIFVTEIGFGESYSSGRTLTVVRVSGVQHRIAVGLGTQETVNNAAASLSPATIKFTCSPVLVLHPGDSVQALGTGGQGYWSGYARP